MLHPSVHAQKDPNHPAYIMATSGEVVTYGQLESRSNQGAHLLRQLGVKQGDHIALMMENNPRFFEVVWAAQRAGVYYTPVSYYLTPAEAAYIVNDCGAKVFISSLAQADKLAGLNGEMPNIEGFYMVDGCVDGYVSWESSLSEQPETPIADQSEGREMLYSSGTTGKPKGIKLPLGEGELGDTEEVKRAAMFAQFLGVTPQTCFLSTSPLYHSAPLGYNMSNFRMGATSIIMEKFDAELALQLIEKYKISYSQWVPTMFVRLTKLPAEIRERYDVSSMNCAIHGAAPCPANVKQSMIEWWGPIIIEFYSGSERNGIFMINSDEWLQHKGSVGRCMDAQVHIVNEETGDELPVGEIGTIYTSGSSEFEYHNDPDKTASTRLTGREDWSTIGDVGYVDEEGYLYLTDRKSYTIITGGINVYPQETEDCLINHADVFDVAVFGVPNEDFGEEVKAVVQPADFSKAGPELEAALIAYCQEHLSKIKCPRTVDFEKELPREDTGKLKKRLIKDRYWPEDNKI